MRDRFVKQRHKKDCGIAAVATVANKSYTEIRRVCGPVRDGLNDHEMLWLLNHYGNWRVVIPRKAWTLAEWAKKYPLCVASIGWPFDKYDHAIAIVDGKIFCPSRGHNISPVDHFVITSIVPDTHL